MVLQIVPTSLMNISPMVTHHSPMILCTITPPVNCQDLPTAVICSNIHINVIQVTTYLVHVGGGFTSLKRTINQIYCTVIIIIIHRRIDQRESDIYATIYCATILCVTTV